MARILIVDDEPHITRLLERSFASDGHQVSATSDPEHGLQLLKEEPFELLISDLRMPVIDGLELLRRSKMIRPSCEVVLITGFATVETAREALKRGAVDYVTKPFSIENELKPLIRKVLADSSAQTEQDLESSDRVTPKWSSKGDPEQGIVAGSPAMDALLVRAERVAHSNAPVLLRGESGTGKEVIANLIHRRSARADRPMVTVNCAALPDTLLESELFGSTKGAFTGAISDRVGFFEAADGGTIFLDEIGEISPSFQPKLLRVLEGGEFHRIGDARRKIRVDVRIIAATNRNLEHAIETGHFRPDLFYRLNVVPLEIPPLRERMEELPKLLEHFAALRESPKRFSADALAALKAYRWPGNVREVAKAVEHACVLGDGPVIVLEDLPSAIQAFTPSGRQPGGDPGVEQDTLQEIEIRCILQAMAKTAYNRTQAARLLGLTRRTLGYRIEKFELSDEIERRKLEAVALPSARTAKVRHIRSRSARKLGT